MKTLVLQNLIHRGTVLAEGFLFSAKLLPENEIRQRILSLWQPNTKVFRFAENLILLLPRPLRTDCRYSIGLPLVKYGQILSAFPLQKRDLEFFVDFTETILLSNEGWIETIFLKDLQTENIEEWFDVSNFQVVETKTLGEVRSKPVSIEKVENIDLRGELKDVPKADEKLAEILHVLRQKKAELEKAKKQNTFSIGGYSGSAGSSSNIFGGLFDSLKGLFSTKSDGQQGWQHPSENQPKPPGTLRKLFTKAMFQLKIGQLVGREQAKYLAKMMEMFENGDLQEALKHAIPLEDMQALKEMSEKMPFLGFLRPRDDLQINYGRQTASGSSVHLEDEWFNGLRQLYRQTFERLVAQNRIEEAAFVLAELLKSNHEAVEFLEKHGKYRLAAQLAESRDLPKETIVRQWFLAGEKRRAIQLAVLHNCFEYVVNQLEKQNNPAAAELREIWAENLAESGNYAAAINVIWHLKGKHGKAKDWINKVIEFGGVPAGQMLAKKITLFPATFDEVKTKLQEVLTEDGNEGMEKRIAFAHEASKVAANQELRTLIRPLARRLLADLAKDSRWFSANEFRHLVEISQDYSLRTDLPIFPKNDEKNTYEPLQLIISENDRGATSIYDACLLPDGKLAVALGEAGVKIISRKGTTIAHFDQPTEKFIVSDLGTKAICLASRGEVWRLAKIDFVERKATYWCDAVFQNFAVTFDGNLWFIGLKDEIYAIDTTAKNFESVWRVSEIGGNIAEISRSKSKLMLLIIGSKGIEKWWYDLPGFTLRSRNEPKWLQMENENQAIYSLSSFVAYAVITIEEKREDSTRWIAKVYDYDTQIAKFEFSPETQGLGTPQIVENKYIISQTTENERIIALYETPNVELAKITMSKDTHFSTKLDEKFLTIADEFGRVIIFDHQAKVLRKNVRI
jgi:hypothetical protein